MRVFHLLCGHRATKALYALLTAVLLAPAPVMAFSWVSGLGWQIATQFGPTGSVPTFKATDGNTGSGGSTGTVQVQVPTVSGSGLVAASVIELSRQLTLTKGATSEVITANQIVNAFVLNASVKTKVWFTPVVAGTNATAPGFNKSAGNTSATVTGAKTKGTKLSTGAPANAGNYVVHLRIIFQTKGRANHTNSYGGPATASTFTFTFAGN
jgi:hypothetical protein